MAMRVVTCTACVGERVNIATLARYSPGRGKPTMTAAAQPEPTNNRPPRLQQVCMVVRTLAAVATPYIAWLTYEYMIRH